MVLRLIIFGFLVHALIVFAAFEIYFSSPIDQGMTPVRSTDEPPAKRLVLLVADGLRANALYNTDLERRYPNLLNIRQLRGSWGTSHTRVPTESRPGHVAILGGIFEDPSAVLKGWQANPVNFDSVINQSTNAWCWGSPDIVNVFNKDKLPHIHLDSYDANLEDFGKKATSELDVWVLEKVKTFIKEKANCENCYDFRESGNFFFLHLLGIDTAGHGFKPQSQEYARNIKVVDEIVGKVEDYFESTFPDNSTAYVFTADHGMTDWGSHGAGSDDETLTPIIAWGSGIKIDKKRKDVNQTDIAPLLSSIIGINIPINSIGKLPTEYLDVSPKNLNKMLISNVQELMEIFKVKMTRIEKNALYFVPYLGLSLDDVEVRVNALQHLFLQAQYEILATESKNLMDFLIDGADYYHNYYQIPILTCVTFGFILWVLYLGVFVVTGDEYPLHHPNWLLPIMLTLLGSTCCGLYAQSSPISYYIYFTFPICMFYVIITRRESFLMVASLLRDSDVAELIFNLSLFVSGVVLLVSGFFYRGCFSLVIYLMVFWVISTPTLEEAINKKLLIMWIGFCSVLSLFPILPAMGAEFSVYPYVSGLAAFSIITYIVVFHYPYFDRYSFNILRVQLAVFALTPIYVATVHYNWISSDSIFKNISWILAFFPICLISCTATNLFTRLSSVFIAFGPLYAMLSMSYETAFLSVFICFLFLWLKLEAKQLGQTLIHRMTFNDKTGLVRYEIYEDFRRGLFFVALILLGFFGTGNLASLNSFDPMSVRCFMTIFSPFKMSALIILKIAVPIIFVACTFRAIHVIYTGDMLRRFCAVLFFSDIMLFYFLFAITNVGSWATIGISLSHFIIMEAFTIIILFMYGIAYVLTSLGPKTYFLHHILR